MNNGKQNAENRTCYERRRSVVNALKVFDLGVVLACFLLAAAFAAQSIPDYSLVEFLSMRVKISNFLLFGVFVTVWHFTLSAVGLYQSGRLASFGGEVLDILKAISFGTGLLLILSVTLPIEMIDNQFLITFSLSNLALLILGRWVIRFALNWARLLGRNHRDVVIVGANNRALKLASRFQARPELGYRIKGFVDDQDAAAINRIKRAGYHWLGSLGDLGPFVTKNAVDEVIVCLPIKSFYEEIARIVALCEAQGVIVRLLPDLFNLMIGRLRMDALDGVPIVTITTGTLDGYGLLLKRLFDVVVSSILLAVLLPVLLTTALLIKATSPGPVFFVQDRLGRSKRLFKIFKFRTMVVGADRMQQQLEHLNQVDGAAFKIRNDPRITPIGRFLRETSIDELPQFFNVVKGDMSLVGPRPLPVRDYENFSVDWHRRRFSVKPGITCLWQVSGRSDLDFHQWMELDMSYIDHWSLWLDAKILLRTVPAVFQRRGAV